MLMLDINVDTIFHGVKLKHSQPGFFMDCSGIHRRKTRSQHRAEFHGDIARDTKVLLLNH